MKKVITLALALVLLVAFAAPAAALVPDNALGTTNSSARFSLSLQLASAMPVAGATLYIPEIPANKAWVTNEILYFVGQITAFKDYVNPATVAPIVNGNNQYPATSIQGREEAALRLTGTGVSIYNQAATINWMFFDTTMPAGTAYANAWRPFANVAAAWTSDYTSNYIQLPAYSPINTTPAATAPTALGLNALTIQNAQNTNYMFYGYGFVTGAVAQPSVKAEIRMFSLPQSPNSASTIIQYKGINKDYVITRLANIGSNPVYAVAYIDNKGVTPWTGHAVMFEMDSNTNKCIRMDLVPFTLGTTPARGANTAITKGDWYDGANYIPNTWLYVAGPSTNVAGAELTALTNVFTYLGFDYALLNTNAVLAKDFIAKIDSTNIADTATATLYAGTPPITEPPTGVTPPKTGDSASILGFVMIGMAIVAAAGVAYRKVRA